MDYLRICYGKQKCFQTTENKLTHITNLEAQKSVLEVMSSAEGSHQENQSVFANKMMTVEERSG